MLNMNDLQETRRRIEAEHDEDAAGGLN